jgi:predicted RNA binding protein with dsRBD fold (UPF0201 family)
MTISSGLHPRGPAPQRVLRITARAPLRPTEDAARVRAALLALFPRARIEERAGELHAEGDDGERLRDLVRAERIPDSARGQMLHGMSPDGATARFRLAKQAAAVGRASFGALGGPLGEIDVEIAGEPGEVERAIYRIAPDTTVPLELAEVPPSERPPSL